MSAAQDYLLIKRDLYWRPNSQGYTGIRSEAGRYSQSEAASRVGDGVTMVLASEAPEYSSGCDLGIKANRLLVQRDELLAALKSAVKVAGDAATEWDNAPEGMRAGKIIIALAGELKGYRSDTDAIHRTIAEATA